MINISIVIYNHPFIEIEHLVILLASSPKVNELFLIDNSAERNDVFLTLPSTYVFNGKNLGYGKAHNIAIRRTIEQNIPYHLVINPDIQFDGDALVELVDFMDKNKDVGLLMPKIIYPDGSVQYLCKLLPKPSDLIYRRFLPPKWTRKSNNLFELRHSGYNKMMEVPYLSGCFMLLRTEVLKEVGLFDERYFMYPEDIDLSRRIHRKYRTIFYPNVKIIHHHVQGSYVSNKLLLIHMWNIAKYFTKWGWIFDKERKKVNEETLNKLKLL